MAPIDTPWEKVVGDHGALEAGPFRSHGELNEVTRTELLGRCFVTDLDGHSVSPFETCGPGQETDWCAKHHRMDPIGSPCPYCRGTGRAPTSPVCAAPAPPRL